MRERVLTLMAAIALAAALAAPAATAPYMQSASPEPSAKTLTPQQQKLKNCGAEWQAMKQNGKTEGITWAQYRRDCLRKRGA
jgi:hypothetical protein